MKTTERKLLCTDLDGTLLNTSKKITPRTLDAINEMVSAGHRFAFATGRPIQSSLPLAAEYGFNRLDGFYIISYNGALIYDCHAEKTIFTLPLERKFLRIIFDAAAASHIHCHTYDKTNVVSEHKTAMLEEYTRIIKVPPVVVDNVDTYLEVEPLKIICADLYDRKKLEMFQNRMAPVVDGHLASVFSSDILLEYSAIEATKGNGVMRLCSILNIPFENSIAAGDQENDITMLHSAGLGCAMANATLSTKEAAGYVTENDNDHDGIAEIIYRFILNSSDSSL